MNARNIVLFGGLFLLACTNPSPEDDPESEKEDVIELTDEAFLRRHVEGILRIPATEDFTIQFYTENLNGDEIPDYIVTVNRLQFALQEAIESGNPAKRAELGYMGNFNYIFYMNGANRNLSSPIAVPSSPHTPLKITFEKVRSEAYFDVLVDFRIRNSGWRRYFTILRDQAIKTFEMKCFDGLGTTPSEAFTVKYDKGSYSLAKDILVYRAKLQDLQFDDPLEMYTVDPEITPLDELDRRWFFNDREGKYYTNK